MSAWDDAVNARFVATLIAEIREAKAEEEADSAYDIAGKIGYLTLNLIAEAYEDIDDEAQKEKP